MLIRFVVENFLSFKDEAVFDLIATNDSSHKTHIIADNNKVPLLRTAALYGANASGKSNLVLAMDFAKKLIVNGTKSNQATNVRPFRLDRDAPQRSTKFEFTFKHKGVIYNYGFALNKQQIIEEWLFATPKKQEVVFFERITTTQGKVKVEFGQSLGGRNKSSRQMQFLEFIAQGTRPNQLFLTEAVERNVEKVEPVMEWFDNVLRIVRAESRYMTLAITAHENKSFSRFLGDLLQSVGTGISCVTTETTALDFDKEFLDLPDDVKQGIKNGLDKDVNTVITTPENKLLAVRFNENQQPIILKLKMQHETADGEAELFDIEEESEGTQRLIHLAPILFNSKSSGFVWVVDELDRRLHTHLSRAFVKAFLSCEDGVSPKGQLIFTTHDTNLIDANLLRKDEIWFVEKNEYGESKLYSLAEFKPRKGLNLEKGYLNGRFGAIPFINDVCNLEWQANEVEHAA